MKILHDCKDIKGEGVTSSWSCTLYENGKFELEVNGEYGVKVIVCPFCGFLPEDEIFRKMRLQYKYFKRIRDAYKK